MGVSDLFLIFYDSHKYILFFFKLFFNSKIFFLFNIFEFSYGVINSLKSISVHPHFQHSFFLLGAPDLFFRIDDQLHVS